MGFIKAIAMATGQFGETYREVIQYTNTDPSVLVKEVNTSSGMIQDQSRLFVHPGQCAIYTDQGAIKDIITEPGMYYMDTSAPTLFQVDVLKGLGATVLESIKRIAYNGDSILKQKVYFVDITEKVGLGFATETPIIYKDPTWGPIEIKLFGDYSLKVVNPVNLLANVAGIREEYRVGEIAGQIRSFILSELAVSLGNLGVSFDEIASKQTDLSDGIIKDLNKRLQTFGIEVLKVVISGIEVAEEIKKAIRERAQIKMKATSVNNAEADIYTKLNTAEAIKDMANNPSSAATNIMGMNLGNAMAGIITNNTNATQPSSEVQEINPNVNNKFVAPQVNNSAAPEEEIESLTLDDYYQE